MCEANKPFDVRHRRALYHFVFACYLLCYEIMPDSIESFLVEMCNGHQQVPGDLKLFH
jgi:hypothetical protein